MEKVLHSISIILECIAFFLFAVDLYGEERLEILRNKFFELEHITPSVLTKTKSVVNKFTRFLKYVMLPCTILLLLILGGYIIYNKGKLTQPFYVAAYIYSGLMITLAIVILIFEIATPYIYKIFDVTNKFTNSQMLKDKMLLYGATLFAISKGIELFKVWFFK